METFMDDTEESTEDSAGRKKSKLKSLKLRLFGKNKKDGETNRKLSQSTSDITAAQALGSDERLECNSGALGSRALSHDSIFLADQSSTEDEPSRVLSQENVHIKIKALQEKLQQQKFYFGPPPPVNSCKPSEEQISILLSKNNPTINTDENINKALFQMSSNPMIATSNPVSTKFSKRMSPTETALDFSSPAQFTPILDTSAARHRLAVKPRNQRASSKKRHSTVDISETLKEEKKPPVIQEEATSGTVNMKMNNPISLPLEHIKPETQAKPYSIVSSQTVFSSPGKTPTVSPDILRPKVHKPVMPRPHSSFNPSDAKEKSDSSGHVDIQFLRNTQNKVWADNLKSQPMSSNEPFVPGITLHSKAEILHKTTAIKRPFPGSGSFHLSVSKKKEEEERPRSGSFTGVREHWMKTEEKGQDSSSNISPKIDLKSDSTPLFLEKEETRIIKDSLKRVETLRPSETKDKESYNLETTEEETKTTFGVKLRSTSHSVRLRPETASNSEKTPEKQHKQDISKKTEQVSTGAMMAETKQDVSTTPSGASVSAKQAALLPVNTPLVSTEIQPLQVEGTPEETLLQVTSAEVSWMSIAMEKTRSLQNLFASKFSKDFTLAQTAAQSLDARHITPLTSAAKPEAQEHRPPAQTVKPLSTTTAQQNTLTSPLREAQVAKPTNSKSQSIPKQPDSQSVTQGNIWISQSPLRSVRQIENTTQSTSGLSSQQSTSQSPVWSARGLRATGIAVTHNTTADAVRTANKEEVVGQPAWARSGSNKSAFLEKRAETSSPMEIKSEPSGNKEAKTEFKHTVSSPKKISETPKEEKWIHKTVNPSSAPSTSPTLQSTTDSGELSWIELAKRKSRAWSDKTMD